MAQATTSEHTRGFPTLARAVDLGVAARAASRLWRSTFASLSALGEARLSAHRTPRARAEALARLAAELLAIHAVDVETTGVLPERPCPFGNGSPQPIAFAAVSKSCLSVPSKGRMPGKNSSPGLAALAKRNS